MARFEEQDRSSYPRIPAKVWWQLRAQSKKTPPRSIEAGYIATLCEVSEKTAQNLIPSLRAVGLINGEGKTTERLHEWRDDESYAKVCSDILNEVYPSELRELLPPPIPDRTQAARWFARKTQTGEIASNQMAAFYALVAKADPAEPEASDSSDAPRSAKPKSPQKSPKRNGERAPVEPARVQVSDSPSPMKRAPSMHIDIQIHIAPQASPEQIDAIFSSMARHLYRDQP
jgi:hypothetical protein